MVRLAGIEPTTPWFVAKYSIQLSYSRTAANYIKNCRVRPRFSRRAQAIDKILLLAVHFLLHQAVNVGLEAGEFLVE